MVNKHLGFFDHWRHFAAYIYLIICLFDFLIMPICFEIRRPSSDHAMTLAMQYEDGDRFKVLELMQRDREWSPLTLVGGGLFHAAFGMILGVSAWSRGKEKENLASKSSKKSEEDDIVG